MFKCVLINKGCFVPELFCSVLITKDVLTYFIFTSYSEANSISVIIIFYVEISCQNETRYTLSAMA